MTHPTDPALPAFRHPQPSAIYDYRREDGTLDFIVCRWDADGETQKRFQQWHHDGVRWVPKARSSDDGYLRPLYNLPELSSRQAAPVLVVEGEKTFEGCLQYLPEGWVATSWAGGVNGIGRTDWTPLQGRRVVIWPDNDEPGVKAAAAIAAITGGKIIDTSEFPAKWDLADALPDGETAELIIGLITALPPSADIILIPAHITEPPLPDKDPGQRDRGTDDLPVDYIRNDRGALKPLFANALLMLRLNAGRWNLAYDDFAKRPLIDGEPMGDDHIGKIAEWMQHNGMHASLNVISDAIIRAASWNKIHPVKEYLDGLVWDQIPRIDHMLIDHAGADENDENRAFTGRWLIQSAARIYEPGCHARATLVLEGEQDIGKSTILRELFGDKWFTDHLPDITSKDALIQLLGVWCVEIAELATLGRADSARIKQFLTSRVDRYRLPYGRLVADYPRTCVFAGTVNPGATGYLRDESGASRFWPITVKRIDIAAIRANRDQFWAEAVARYKSGENFYLDTDHLIAKARAVQADRYEGDIWTDMVAEHIGVRHEITTSEILRDGIKSRDEAKWSRAEEMRVGKILTHLGWKRFKRRVGTHTQWAYRRPEDDLLSPLETDPT